MASEPTRLRLKEHQVATCPTLKVGYDTYDQAHAAAERGMDLGRVSPGCHLMPYKCEQCGRHHIGNRRVVFKDPPAAETAS